MKHYGLHACLLLITALSIAALADQTIPVTPPIAKLAVTRITMDDQDRSYFADSQAPFTVKEFAPPSGPIGVSAVTDAKTIVFTTADETWATNWHPTPRRQYVIMLSGAVTIEVETGDKRRFETGDVFILEDTRGRGHDSTVVSEEPAVFAMIALPDK